MSTTMAVERSVRIHDAQRRVVVIVVALAIAAGAVLSSGNATFARFIVAAAGAAVFVVLAGTDFRLALTSVFVWLIVLGFIRRLLIPFLGWSPNDPLLLVGPGCALIMLGLSARDLVPRRDALTPYVVFLFLWTLAEVMNPAQGGITTGVKGLLIYLGPLIWFFVGKRLSASQEQLVRRVILWCMIPVLLSGLYQSFIGFFPFEYHWVGVSGFGASIFIEGFKIRPFSTLTSPQEYGFILGIAMAMVWPRVLAPGLHRRRWLAFFVLLLFALILQSSRGLLIFCLVMVLVSTMLWFRSAAATLLLVVMSMTIVFVGSSYKGTVNFGDGQPWVFVNHTVNGLLNPQQSTFPLHQEMVKTALNAATKEPLGVGPGQGSIAAVKSGRASTTAENDFATTAVALGIVPAIILYVLMFTAFALAVRRFRRTHSPFDLATFGILVVCITNWWAVSMYTATTILWVTLGALAAGEARHAAAVRDAKGTVHAA